MEEKKKKSAVIRNSFIALGRDLKDIVTTFTGGDWKTRLSYLIMGFGQLARGQYLRGAAFLGAELGLLLFILRFGADYLKDVLTLGTKGRGWNPDGTVSNGDNSFFILLILSLMS